MKEKFRLTKRDIDNLICLLCLNHNGLPATVFASFPLFIKRHCVQVGAVAGLMAKEAPDTAIPNGMVRGEYANAVRYGSLYHHIGAYIVYNQQGMLPAAGEKFLRAHISERELMITGARQVILETVLCFEERYDGSGYPSGLAGSKIPFHASICAIANAIDEMLDEHYGPFCDHAEKVRALIIDCKYQCYSPESVECFEKAFAGISDLYKIWQKTPPIWKVQDIKPFARPIEQCIG